MATSIYFQITSANTSQKNMNNETHFVDGALENTGATVATCASKAAAATTRRAGAAIDGLSPKNYMVGCVWCGAVVAGGMGRNDIPGWMTMPALE